MQLGKLPEWLLRVCVWVFVWSQFHFGGTLWYCLPLHWPTCHTSSSPQGHNPLYHAPETQHPNPLFNAPVTKHANFEYTDDQTEALPLPEEQLDTFEDEEVETEQIPDESTKVFKKVS